MDKEIRNKLRNVVSNCRRILETSLSEQLQGKYGIQKGGQIEDESHMSHLLPDEQEYRRQLITHIEHIQAIGFKPEEAIEQLIREVAFTHLNRLCSYKMLEERKYIRESVSRGLESNGFKRYLADNPEDENLWSSGQQDIAYRHFLNWLGSTLSEEIGVLFSPNDPSNRFYPPQRILEQILGLINQDELKEIWSQDETIGWIYQYFTPKELRDKARKESQAPRNSYELAFRNQFYTPRYVVQFLTDNTLGRTWYEMRQGNTSLKDICEYLVHRPNEIFLKKDETVSQRTQNYEDLSQEELLKQPLYIKFREKKDPRDIKILDPACGSGHFLLYCFDILETIYRESYSDVNASSFSETGKTLREEFIDETALAIAIPSMILRYNLHGIDIDLRATQIASLGLWLRAQKAFYSMGITSESRPKITRMNIVCAEPMPGEKDLLEDFIKDLKPRVLGDLVRVVFNKMTLVNEAGSLLKIDVELKEAIANARQQWITRPKSEQLTLFPTEKQRQWSQSSIFDVRGISNESFWQDAEDRVIEALKEYASRASNGSAFRKNLFVEDAEHGFSFIELFEKKYDVILMNPPFGASCLSSKKYIDESYPRTKNDVYAAFIERGIEKLVEYGMLGAITSRTGFFLSTFKQWREEILMKEAPINLFLDLGHGVLDTALVEAAAYVLYKDNINNQSTIFFRLIDEKPEIKESKVKGIITETNHGKFTKCYINYLEQFTYVPASPFCYWISDDFRKLFKRMKQFEGNYGMARKGLDTGDDFRFLRLFWEVDTKSINYIHFNTIEKKNSKEIAQLFLSQSDNNKKWSNFTKGGEYAPYLPDVHLLINWERRGYDIKNFRKPNGDLIPSIRSQQYYYYPGLTWSRRTTSRFSIRLLPYGVIFSHIGNIAIPSDPELIYSYLALFSSNVCFSLIKLSVGADDAAAKTYDVGIIQRLPIPELSKESLTTLKNHALRFIDLKMRISKNNEVSHYFVLPSILEMNGKNLSDCISEYDLNIQYIRNQLDDLQNQIDNIVYIQYGITNNDRTIIEKTIDERPSPISDIPSTSCEHIFDLISYIIGSIFGRWDIRYALNKKLFNGYVNITAPLLPVSIGMLQDNNGISLINTPVNYPIDIDWDGILVDDELHPKDIVKHIKEIFYLIWGNNADSIELEANNILGVNTLREYIRKSGKGGFWEDHIKNYTKSRRKAPIYWLLQSSKKNYALWIYYHRFNRDTHFKAIEYYVKPKIQQQESKLAELKLKRENFIKNGNSVKAIDLELEKTESFITELIEFKDALTRVALLDLTPDLDDGVILNIAPLHEIVPWDEAKKYWNELLQGKYEWSSIGKQLRAKGLVKTQRDNI